MEQIKEAVYLINDERYLHLRENGAGVGFATYNKVTGEPLESGQISEKNLPPDGQNTIPAARNWYLFELSDDDRKAIQQESVNILENIPQAGIGRRRIWEPETLPKDIRLINSHYDDLYRIPDGGVIQVDYPDGRSFTARVEHLDDYHFDMGGLGNVFHICQFAEVMERNHADFYPEIQTQDEQAAWELGGKGYLAIQSCEDGWDYTIYHSDFSVMDGGQLDAPELTIQEAREQILEAHHMEKGRRLLQDYPPKESNRDRLCSVIDEILQQKPTDYEDFLQKLEQQGYEIKRGKYTSVKGARQKRFIRLKTLGAGYSEDEIKAVIAGKAEHRPHQKQPPKEQPFQLLVDIQAKLAEGKGGGYERWAKKYNLKEMSKTLIFLQEQKIGSADDLKERADAALSRYHKLGDSIKAAEKRMAEIAVLRAHIVN